MYYVLTKDNIMLGVMLANPYDLQLVGISIHEFDEPIPDLNIYTWDSVAVELKKTYNTRTLTRLEFSNRLTPQERVAIAASTDPIVSDIMRMLNVAEYVNLDDPNTIQGINYFASINLITQSRIQEILA